MPTTQNQQRGTNPQDVKSSPSKTGSMDQQKPGQRSDSEIKDAAKKDLAGSNPNAR